MSALEDRYRRLLRWYPADHRSVHEEEMLGVLLAAAGPDRTRPAARDAFDLIRGGLGIRLRHAPRSLAESGWRDAGALLSVIVPLTLLLRTIGYAVQAGLAFPEARDAAARGASWAVMFSSAPSWLLWGTAAVAALAGARRTAAAGVLAAVVVEAATFRWLEDYPSGTTMAPVLLGLIMVAAAYGGGVTRGRELLGRAGQAAIVVLLLAASLPRNTPGINWGVRQAILLAAAAVVAGLLVRTAAGRRAAIVLAAPLSPLVVPFFPGYIDDGLTRFLVGVVAVPAVGSVAALATIVMLERLTGRARRRV